jgi:hypothetical protein
MLRFMTGAPPKKRPLLAAFLSGIFPGLGQLYNHQPLKGALFGVAAVVTGFGPLSPLDTNLDLGDPAGALRALLWASLPFMAVATWSVIDAYRAAKTTARPLNPPDA